MTAVETLLRTARAYAIAADVEMVTVSWRAFTDSKKIAALEAGGDIQTGRYEKAMHWFSANWPAGAAWPEGVPRPFVKGAAA